MDAVGKATGRKAIGGTMIVSRTSSKIRHLVLDGVLVVKPTREDVTGLQVGDSAPDAFGHMARVVSIHAQRDNVHGKAFVCYYTDQGVGSTMSGGMTEDEVASTTAISAKFKQAVIAGGHFDRAMALGGAR